ncbi:MAG: FKBP-type peptidyl-prolyl cis-trans isomerase [Chitinophagaceae bacterium]
MQSVKKGDTVRVHYHGKLTNGETFDSSEGRQPLEFKVGAGMVIKGFDDGVLEMKPGDKKTVEIPVEQAYGERNEELIIDFPKGKFPTGMELQEGMQLQMTNEHGHPVPVVIHTIKQETVLLDANHPLAGEDLIFDIELVEIV